MADPTLSFHGRACHEYDGDTNYDNTSERLSDLTLAQDSSYAHNSQPTGRPIKYDRERLHRASFISRRWGSRWTQKEVPDSQDSRGPLGLRLLAASPEPLIEVVFVHGLRGGSIKTWQKGSDHRLFWPQHWLPLETEFRNANIHSFGYESDWRSLQSSNILGLNDFGQALYQELKSSPTFRRNPENPIILVGHSMGGLVIKKTFGLAQRDDSSDIARRIQCIFFLATPQRGSDHASLLSNVLKVFEFAGVKLSRDYINDLTAGSSSIQSINEEFRRYAEELMIYSFYETLPTSIGVSSSIIVDKSSAILGDGFKNERTNYINASHGNVCKFSDLCDPNYLSVKNSLGAAVQELLADLLNKSEKRAENSLKSIRTFLGVPDEVESQHDRAEGSCQWIDDRIDFQEWRDSPNQFDKTKKYRPSMYWVTASPGAGKTVLVTHIISQLQEFRLQHAAHYFHIGKKDSQTLSGLLRSIALQMATSNAAIRDGLSKLCAENSPIDLDDARALWSKIFKGAIFQTAASSPQYWVIDAIDECIKYAEFFSLFKGCTIGFPLKIFLTGRKIVDMPKMIRHIDDMCLYTMDIPLQSTMGDIELYVGSRIPDLPVDRADQKQELESKIIAKSSGSFLWARLVLDELEGVYDYESISEVLQGIPEGMVPYYQRATTEMANNKRERHIARAILLWVALATRPLTVAELSQALELDIKAKLSSLKSAIGGLCGHLVSVDSNDRVRIVHTTAREFLFSETAGEFRLTKCSLQDIDAYWSKSDPRSLMTDFEITP
ncbi:unnamed protein product [Clonostachys rosea]|uniref:GPI inositol-deacylase n=1 Tax=Bionectria ochroleuca TaxID=29856 RepID=A0ABY6TRG9_BIOOC|nr:unnamed protein product [Clonostachys rosea]